MTQLEFTHRRKNPLTGEWVLVSPHRNNRPWLGATENNESISLPSFEPSCPLCPSNTRANGETNPNYAFTHVFTNDFGALNKATTHLVPEANDLFCAEVAEGECRVVCFSPDHNKTIPELTQEEIEAVIATWKANYQELSSEFSNVHIFENKGEIMGCSQPHPHGQIWAHNHQSTEISLENSHQQTYKKSHQSQLLGDYVDKEMADDVRIVCQNQHWIAVVPFWAAWPFETLLVAKDDLREFGQINQAQSSSLACILKELTIRYDNIFNCSFPYSMGWHSAPSDLTDNSHWRLHAHFYPPLLRSATVKKHMVGYEMLAESQRDLSAETAAKILRDVSKVHYKQGNENV